MPHTFYTMQSRVQDIIAQFEITLSPSGATLRDLHAALNRFSEERVLSGGLRYRLELIIDELVTNNMVHGGCCSNCDVMTVRILDCSSELIIEIIDTGHPFDPTAHPSPPPCTENGLTGIGKAGLCLVRHLVRDIKYQRTADRNYLTLILNK